MSSKKILKSGKNIIYTHDLLRLAQLARLPVDEELKLQLYEITTFNLAVRCDDSKLAFFKRADE